MPRVPAHSRPGVCPSPQGQRDARQAADADFVRMRLRYPAADTCPGWQGTAFRSRPQQKEGDPGMIEICGSSDDLIEVSGCAGADEFYADKNGRWQADLVGPDPAEQLRVHAEFDPAPAGLDGTAARSGCWVISLSQTDESVPFPPWENKVAQHENGYSTVITVDAPDGTRLTNIAPPA